MLGKLKHHPGICFRWTGTKDGLTPTAYRAGRLAAYGPFLFFFFWRIDCGFHFAIPFSIRHSVKVKAPITAGSLPRIRGIAKTSTRRLAHSHVKPFRKGFSAQQGMYSTAGHRFSARASVKPKTQFKNRCHGVMPAGLGVFKSAGLNPREIGKDSGGHELP